MAEITEGTQENLALPPIKGVPIGTMLAYGGLVDGSAGGELARQGWLVCNGEKIGREDYPELFSIIGSSFGAGDRVKTFNLPDLRGQFLRGVDDGAGKDPEAKDRTASAEGGNTGDEVGSAQEDAFKAHLHDYTVFHKTGCPMPYRYMGAGGAETKLKSDETGGKETRPKNIYVNWIIKAKDV